MVPFLSKIIKINNLNVIGVHRMDGFITYNVLTVKKNGNKLTIVSTTSFETYEGLLQGIDLKLPVILNIDGNGVLNKAIDFNNEVDLTWHKNIDYNTIYHTSLKSSKSSFMSFCRKNIIEETIVLFKQNFSIIDVYIGSFLSGLLYNTLKSDVVISGSLMLEFENGELIHFSKQIETRKEKYTIGDDTISSDLVPLYGVLIHFFLRQSQVSKTTNEELSIDEILYKKAFNVFGVAMLASFLLALLTSFLLIQYYGSKNAELNLKNVYANKSYQHILELERQKEKKQKIVMESGLMSSKFLTFYGYEILKTVPADISLTDLNVIPLLKPSKANQKMVFETRMIIVKGETYEGLSFNNWLESLRKINWIKKFEIMSLKKDKKNKSQFEIKITMKDV